MDISLIIADLGANYNSDDEAVLTELLTEVTNIASHISNQDASTNDAFNPYIMRAVKSMYLSRGAEGLSSRNEGSISNSFQDVEAKLRDDIIKNGLRRIK